MRGWKRLFYYLLINVLVSLCVTLGALQWWTLRQPEEPHNSAVATPSPPPASQVLPAAQAVERTVVITVLITTIPNQPTPYPTRGIVSYTVRAGDTLGGIAVLFGIGLDELMELNSLSNPDQVFEGQVLLIPPPPTPTAAPSPTRTPTPGDTATPRPSPTPRFSPTPSPENAAGPQVTISGIFGAGALATERVEIRLDGAGEQPLAGWKLVDEQGNTFEFPTLTLRSGAAVNVYTRAGRNSVNELFWNQLLPVWTSGETATLLDAQGNAVAVYVTP